MKKTANGNGRLIAPGYIKPLIVFVPLEENEINRRWCFVLDHYSRVLSGVWRWTNHAWKEHVLPRRTAATQEVSVST